MDLALALTAVCLKLLFLVLLGDLGLLRGLVHFGRYATRTIGHSVHHNVHRSAVLLLWIYVVYNKNRWVLAVMGACYIAEVASVLTILAISFENFEGAPILLSLVPYRR